MLTVDEVEYLYRLAQRNAGKGVIVEIGSWKGKSTIALARGASLADNALVYAIDPHKPFLEESYSEDTEAEFLTNLKNASVQDQVIPMTMTSEDAARGWNRPIRLLWIDGDHRYEAAKLDFTLWEPHLIEGGILAMHDTIRKNGPKRVLWENIFRSKHFQEISIVDNITAIRKVQHVSLKRQFEKWMTIGARALYIAARKSRVPYSKLVGRRLLKKFTAHF